MEVSSFSQLASFPSVWLERGLLAGPFFEAQARAFEREYGGRAPDGGTEHWRYGAFVHWLRSQPSRQTVQGLVEAALQDPDRPMAGNVILQLAALPAFDEELLKHVIAKAPSHRELGVAPKRLLAEFSAAHPQRE